MTYQECEKLINGHLAAFQRERFFIYNFQNAEWEGFIIAPEDATLAQKEQIFAGCLHRGMDNKLLLLDMGLFHGIMRAFIIFKQGGYQIILPFHAFLENWDNKS